MNNGYSDYYIWLDSLVNDGRYSKLIRHLYECEFRWQFILDKNRAAGGLNLRYEYSCLFGISFQDIGSGPCSIL